MIKYSITYLKVAKRIDVKCSYHKKEGNYAMMVALATGWG